MVDEPRHGDGVEIAPGVRVPESALRVSYSGGSGPGGQNVNKRAMRAELRVALADLPIPADARRRLASLASHWLVDDSELRIVSGEHRTQSGNRRACLERLREFVVLALVRPKVRRRTRPTRGSVERRLQTKKQRGEKKRRRGQVDE